MSITSLGGPTRVGQEGPPSSQQLRGLTDNSRLGSALLFWLSSLSKPTLTLQSTGATLHTYSPFSCMQMEGDTEQASLDWGRPHSELCDC